MMVFAARMCSVFVSIVAWVVVYTANGAAGESSCRDEITSALRNQFAPILNGKDKYRDSRLLNVTQLPDGTVTRDTVRVVSGERRSFMESTKQKVYADGQVIVTVSHSTKTILVVQAEKQQGGFANQDSMYAYVTTSMRNLEMKECGASADGHRYAVFTSKPGSSGSGGMQRMSVEYEPDLSKIISVTMSGVVKGKKHSISMTVLSTSIVSAPDELQRPPRSFAVQADGKPIKKYVGYKVVDLTRK